MFPFFRFSLDFLTVPIHSFVRHWIFSLLLETGLRRESRQSTADALLAQALALLLVRFSLSLLSILSTIDAQFLLLLRLLRLVLPLPAQPGQAECSVVHLNAFLM